MEEQPKPRSAWMRMNPMHRAIGLVLIAVGIAWFLLGIGMIEGSQFSGKLWFAIVGIVLVNVGGIVLHRAAKNAPGSGEQG